MEAVREPQRPVKVLKEDDGVKGDPFGVDDLLKLLGPAHALGVGIDELLVGTHARLRATIEPQGLDRLKLLCACWRARGVERRLALLELLLTRLKGALHRGGALLLELSREQ